MLQIKIIVSSFVLLGLAISCQTKSDSTSGTEEVKTADYSAQDRYEYLLNYEVAPESFPRALEENGAVRKVPSKDWVSGFFAGNLLYIYKITGDKAYLAKAEEWLPYLEKEKNNGGTHDMGFKIYCSFGNALKITGKEQYKDVILTAAETLSTRYNATVGCTKSWDWGLDWKFPVIIDNMMNLELLFEATLLSGDSSFHKMADNHAATTMANHFRADNSCYHVVDYDPNTGEVLEKVTHQGIADESAWARGQGWGLYGFTMAYRYTKKEAYLDQAKKIAAYVMNHPRLPEDKVPYWDLDDPKIPNAPRDASAASVIASALIELYQHSKDQTYLDFAKSMMESLKSSDYLISAKSDVPFIIDHSVGNMPKKDEIDKPIAYGDYYFLEALFRLNNLK